MRYLFTFSLLFLFSCSSKKSDAVFRTNFTKEEQKIIHTSKEIIKSAYFTTLITLDSKQQPRARIVEPFLPKENFTIWIATNPKSRKVKQLKKNSKATLHYFDKEKLAYVSLMGNAFLVNDATKKQEIWKDGWEKFYPNKKTDYLLIKFIPNNLELISISDNFTGDKTTWMPHRVVLKE